ncbi:hypothetical protein F5884DRAFT_349630 [Xylogone sp. PMI_703]|nr:hypothetical protein F5884DRAFT_349630 [Xylogone sp. PMI_703]
MERGHTRLNQDPTAKTAESTSSPRAIQGTNGQAKAVVVLLHGFFRARECRHKRHRNTRPERARAQETQANRLEEKEWIWTRWISALQEQRQRPMALSRKWHRGKEQNTRSSFLVCALVALSQPGAVLFAANCGRLCSEAFLSWLITLSCLFIRKVVQLFVSLYGSSQVTRFDKSFAFRIF